MNLHDLYKQSDYKDEIGMLFNNDCFNIMNKIQDKSIDLILCDLPYGQTKFEWDKILPFNKLWAEYNRIIKNDGAIILFAKQPFTSKLVLSNEEMFKYELIWEKTRASNNMQVKKQPSAIHENILVFYKNQPIYNDIKFKVEDKYIDKRKTINDSYYHKGHYEGTKMKRKADDGWRHPQSILPFNSVWRKDMHPTEKPIELLEWLILSYTNPNDIVLDNTMGYGSTCVASKMTNRKFIGIEKEIEYYNKAIERLQNVDKLNYYTLENGNDFCLYSTKSYQEAKYLLNINKEYTECFEFDCNNNLIGNI